MLKQVCPLTVFLASRAVHLSGGHLAPRKQLTSMTWQYSLGPCSFLVASGRVPGITLRMRDDKAWCPRVRDKNICWSHGVVGCLSSPTENTREAHSQAISRMCPIPVRGTASPGTRAQRSANTETNVPTSPSASASRQGWGQKLSSSGPRLRCKAYQV